MSSIGGLISSTVINLGLGTLSNLINLVPSDQINTIQVDATLEEIGTDTLQITEHPVEAGANITDHAFYRPAELVMHCGWSNANALFTTSVGGNQTFAGGSLTKDDYVSSIYSQLLALQQSLQPFSVVTTIRLYNNMVITSISLTRDKRTSQALMVTVTLKQIIIVNTLSTTLAPTANQTNPASTSETANYGALSLLNNPVPSPQGSLPPSQWQAPEL
jgi:hypothetical protein